MDIINTQKQKKLREMAALRRHQKHIHAGDELLGSRRLHRQFRATHGEPYQNSSRREISHITHSSQKNASSTLARKILAFIAAISIFVLGSFAYVGFKAYNATTNMHVVARDKLTPPVDLISSKSDSNLHTETITLTQRQDNSHKDSILQETFSAAGSFFGKRTVLAGESDGIINILLLGKGVDGHPGKDLTDTIMIARINISKGKIALLSLPRDLYVRIPGTKQATKINALYSYGLEKDGSAATIVSAIENITQLPMHYFLVADFDAFISVVDALGGINVDVERDINDTRYPGPNYSYETFTLSSGLQHLDGSTALKYVRTRHGDPEGDFGRAKRQQHVLQAIKNKAFSLGTLSNPASLGKIFDALGAHVRTNMSIAEMTSFVALLPRLDTQNITTVVVDAWKPDSLLRVMHVGKMFALVPRAGRFDYSEIRISAQTIFERLAQERLRTEVARENPRIVIVRRGASMQSARFVQELLTSSLDLPKGRITIDSSHSPDTLQPHARIIDHTDTRKPFTLTALVSLIGAEIETAQDNQSIPSADVVILLGNNADTFFKNNLISREEFDNADVQYGNRVIIQTVQ